MQKTTRRRAMAGLLATGPAGLAAAQPRAATPAQTFGPFYPALTQTDADADLTRVHGRPDRARGQVIEVSGRVLDARGVPVPGATLVVWQANAAGRYDHPRDDNPAALDPAFQGYARLRTGRDGAFRLISVKPGAYPAAPGRPRTPHIHFDVRGPGDRLGTQMYFPAEPLNATDLVLEQIRAPELVIARPAPPSAAGVRRYTWDVVLPA